MTRVLHTRIITLLGIRTDIFSKVTGLANAKGFHRYSRTSPCCNIHVALIWPINNFEKCAASPKRVSPDPKKIVALTDMPPLKTKKELQSFLGILVY